MSAPQYSTTNHMRLKFIKPESFGGINKESSLAFFFPEDKNITVATGDQGTNKSSLLEAIKFIFTGYEPDNAINSIDNNKKIEAIFEEPGTGKKFEIRGTRTGFTITSISGSGPDAERAKIESPKEWLRNRIGSVGVDPSFLKSMGTGEQVKWVRSIVSMPDEAKAKEKELKEAIDKKRTEREGVGRIVKGHKTSLVGNGYFRYEKAKPKVLIETQAYKEGVLKYAESVDDKQAATSKAYEAALQKKSEYKNTQDGVDRWNEVVADWGNKISQLEEQLSIAKNEKEKAQQQATLWSEKLKAEFNNVEEEFAKAKADFDTLNTYVQEKIAFDTTKEAIAKYRTGIQTYDTITSDIEKLEEDYQLFVKQYNPPIEGVEVCISAGLDLKKELATFKEENEDATPEEIEAFTKSIHDKNKEGIYYKGHSISELCESELWEFCTMYWKSQGIRAIFVENLNSLGTNAIDSINVFAKNGGMVFASLMKRGQERMEVTFYNDMNEVK